jgi:hypothetical protein
VDITLLLAVVEASTDVVEVTPATTTPTEAASQSEDGRDEAASDEAIGATTATTDEGGGWSKSTVHFVPSFS